jgi:hypothetical protein
MTRQTIVRRITRIEKDLQHMEARLMKQVTSRKARPFTGLRGLWKGATFSDEDVRAVRLHSADDA